MPLQVQEGALTMHLAEPHPASAEREAVRVSPVRTATQLDSVRALLVEFVAWHRSRHAEDLHLVEMYFDEAAYQRELAELPGHYAPPHGTLLLADVDGDPAGCVALRGLDAESCEMKRMFVRTPCRGHGVGRHLAEAAITAACDAGYRTMHLDTSVRQAEALTLYRRLGFTEAEPPDAPTEDLPPGLRKWLVFLRLDLTA